MAFTIEIGKILPIDLDAIVDDANEEEYSPSFTYRLDVQPCEGTEPENLTDIKYTSSQGLPVREPSYSAWDDFMDCSTGTTRLGELFEIKNDIVVYALNVNPVKESLEKIESEIESMNPDMAEKAKWLCFWAREAIKRYGNYAAIKFS